MDRLHQSASAQNAHHPFHVLGQDVQRHFGADVLERLEVRGSHPRLYRAEGVLDSLAAYAHLVWVPIGRATASRTASCWHCDDFGEHT